MNPELKGAATFFSLLAISAFIGWLTGYDFDHRSGMVAYFSSIVLIVSGFVGFIVYAESKR